MELAKRAERTQRLMQQLKDECEELDQEYAHHGEASKEKINRIKQMHEAFPFLRFIF